MLIVGGGGFIGSNFLKFAAENENVQRDFYSSKLDFRMIAPSHAELNIQNVQRLDDVFRLHHPDVVINFAAERDANLAELQRGDKAGSVWMTNVEGVRNISLTCKKFNSFFIHISTDMVFAGTKNDPGPYDEKAKIETNLESLSWYGWTKAEAERRLEDNGNTAIVRIGNVTQPVYDPNSDYVGKILYFFDHNKLYPLFHDQYLTLTYIPFVFEAIETIIKEKPSGIFHVASKDVFTPYDLASYLIEKSRGIKNAVKSVSIEEYSKKYPNRYPKYGGLNVEKTKEILEIPLRTWKEIVDICIQKLNKN